MYHWRKGLRRTERGGGEAAAVDRQEVGMGEGETGGESTPTATPERRKWLPVWLALESGPLKNVLTYVGISGVGGGGFAALCFGIGFLAIRSHDEMLGLPVRVSANVATVRTGAVFFLDSLFYVLYGFWKALAALLVAGLVGWWLRDQIRAQYLSMVGRWRALLGK